MMRQIRGGRARSLAAGPLIRARLDLGGDDAVRGELGHLLALANRFRLDEFVCAELAVLVLVGVRERLVESAPR